MVKDTCVQRGMLAAGLGIAALAAAGCVSGTTRDTLEAAERAASPAAVAALARAQRSPVAVGGGEDARAQRSAGGAGTATAPGRGAGARGESADGADGADGAEDAALGRELGREVELARLQEVALRRHPEIVAAAHRVKALALGARSEGSLPSPELMAELWQVPLARPWAVNDAGMLMLSVTQEIPAAGSLDRAAQAMALEAKAGAAMVAEAARELSREVGRAYAMYVEASARHRAHGAHAGIYEQMSAAARARYTAGGPAADLVKAELERALLEADLAREQGRLDAARAALNALLLRAVDAPLGSPKEVAPMGTRLSPADAAALAASRSPTVAAAEAMKGAAAQRAEAADREATIPSFLVGLSYFHPVGGMQAGWGASVGMSLPWLWGKGSRKAEGEAAKALGEAASAQAARSRARGGAAEAVIAVQEAGRRLVALRDGALPVARQAMETARAGYAAGGSDFLMWLDAAHAALEVELDITEARGDLERAFVELDFAVGGKAPRAPLPALVRDRAHGAAGGGR